MGPMRRVARCAVPAEVWGGLVCYGEVHCGALRAPCRTAGAWRGLAGALGTCRAPGGRGSAEL